MSFVNSSRFFYRGNESRPRARVVSATSISASATAFDFIRRAAALVACSTTISAQGSAFDLFVHGAANVTSKTVIRARAVRIASRGALVKSKTVIRARATVELDLGDRLVINARILSPSSSSPFVNYTARLLINGSPVGIKSFLVNKPSGGVGYDVEIELGTPDPSILSAISSISFQLGKRTTPTSAVAWQELINTNIIASKNYQTSFRGRRLSFTINGGLADKLRLAPRKFLTYYDPLQTAVDASSLKSIPSETGAALAVEALAVSTLSLYYVLQRFVEGCGFTGFETNVPNYQISVAEFSPLETFYDSIKPLLGNFDPVIFERAGKIVILDTTQLLPAGFEPLELLSSDFIAYDEQTQATEPVDGLIINYAQKSLGGFIQTTRFVYPDSDEVGSFGSPGYSRTDYAQVYRDFLDSTSGLLIKSELVSETKTTVSGGVTINEESSTYLLDGSGRRVSSVKTLQARLPDLASGGALTLQPVRTETQKFYYKVDPNKPGSQILNKTTTEISGLLAIDADNTYFGQPFKQDIIEAHRAGNLKDGMTTATEPLKTVIETLETLGNGQNQIKTSTIDHLAGTLVNSYSDIRPGDPGLSSSESSQPARLVIWKPGKSAGEVKGAKLGQIALGDLPLVYGLPLGKRKLAANDKTPRSGSVDVTGFDLQRFREGSTHKVNDRGTARANILVLGWSITGQDLGDRRKQRIATRLDSREILSR